jgi:hypothetical protein
METVQSAFQQMQEEAITGAATKSNWQQFIRNVNYNDPPDMTRY